MMLYTGTTRDKVDSVLRNGITRPFRASYSREHALDQAKAKAERRGGEPVVITVDLWPENMYVDDVAWANPPEDTLVKYNMRSNAEWSKAVRRGEVPLPKNERDWRKSLEIVGWIEHRGFVDPKYLRPR